MSQLVTIYGGSGFVGRYIAQRLARAGFRVRVAVRRPNEAIFVRTYGAVGQVEPVLCNIRDDASVRLAMAGADAVVNCVGILNELGANRFAATQADGAGRIARIAAETGVGRMVHVSAIGADRNSPSRYAQTKAEGEELVRLHMPDAVILRPSIVFGTEDGFFNRFAGMTRFSPILVITGAETRFQPVWVEDVAQAAERAVLGQVPSGTYELGGPEIASFRELVERMLLEIRRRRLIVNLPFGVARVMGGKFDLIQFLTGGLFENRLLTRDQVENLRRDNVADPSLPGLADIGIEPTAMGSVLPQYLWRFRPTGQYSAINESAARLRRS